MVNWGVSCELTAMLVGSIHGTPSLTPFLKCVETREMHHWKLQWPKKTEITEKILC